MEGGGEQGIETPCTRFIMLRAIKIQYFEVLCIYQSQKTRTNFRDFSQRVATEKKPHFKEIVKSVLL